jgi:hypothetical protein
MARKLGASAAAAAKVKTLREVEPAIAEKYGPGLDGKVRGGAAVLQSGIRQLGFAAGRVGRGAGQQFLSLSHRNRPSEQSLSSVTTISPFALRQLKAVEELLGHDTYLQDRVSTATTNQPPPLNSNHHPRPSPSQLLIPFPANFTKRVDPTSQVEVELGTPLDKLFEGEASPLRVLRVVREEGFKLGDRAAHVYSEADRVYAFRAAAEVSGGPNPV